MLFYPTWAGDELHRLIYRNLEKLADSLDGHVLEYFKDNEAVTEDNCPTKEIKGYKCVLDSKATEDNWVNIALFFFPLGEQFCRLNLQDGSLHMAASALNIHGNSTSRSGHRCVVVLIALRLSAVAWSQKPRLLLTCKLHIIMARHQLELDS
ncbi:unnamed protein product [Prunus armeniaca]|uniref:Uncharacterized protein n=1 Tax=Prunus armeniaca TaxID=36596 RepID=A0A6J5WN35_PRUAR|nr:unnamed protein product [Prunus armeniaca]